MDGEKNTSIESNEQKQRWVDNYQKEYGVNDESLIVPCNTCKYNYLYYEDEPCLSCKYNGINYD